MVCCRIGKEFFTICKIWLGVFFAAEGSRNKKGTIFLRIRTIAFLAFSFLLMTAVERSAAIDGLVLHLPGNSYQDTTAYGNNATNNGTVLGTDRYGHANSAFVFSGSSSLIVPNSTSLGIVSGLSVAAWLKIDNFAGMDGWGNWVSQGVHCLFAKDHDRSGLYAFVHGNTSGMGLAIGNNNGGAVSASGVLSGDFTGKWVHVVYTVSPTKFCVFANGVKLAESDVNTGFDVANTRELYFGKFYDQWYPFQGSMSDLRVYSHALSTTEVQEIMKGVIGPLDPLEISLSSTSGAPGNTVAISGNGFTVGETAIRLITKPDGSMYPEEEIPIDNYGKIQSSWQVPADAVDGIYKIKILDLETNNYSLNVSYTVDSTKTIVTGNYYFANVDTASNYFAVWMDISKNNSKNESICNDYALRFTKESGMNAHALGCMKVGDGIINGGNSTRYRFRFKIDADGRAAWFENGTITLVNNADPTITNDLLQGVSVYGSTFDVAKHAWKFINGVWVYPDDPDIGIGSGNVYGRIIKGVRQLIPEERRSELIKSFGDLDWVNSKPEGGCFGLAASAISDFTHADENAWGAGNVDIFLAEIKTYWPDTATEVSGSNFKPFTSDTSLYQKKWDEQTAKKIIYYHAAQAAFGVVKDEWVRGTNGVGSTREFPFTRDEIAALIKTGSPVLAGIKYNKKEHEKGEDSTAGHAFALTQLISFAGQDAVMIWDNNYPYLTNTDSKIGPYRRWWVKDDSVYAANGDGSVIGFVHPINGYTDPDYVAKMDKLKTISIVWANELSPDTQIDFAADPHNIYNLRKTNSALSVVKQQETLADFQEPADTGQEIRRERLQYPDHITIQVVGAKVDSVRRTDTNEPVVLSPNSRIETGKSVIHTTVGGNFNFIYLPVDTDYLVDIEKSSTFGDFLIIVRFVLSNGEIKEIHYDGLSLAAEVSQAYFFAGRGNTDDELHLLAGGAFEPTHIDTALPAIKAPDNFRGIFETGGVRLNWTEAAHPFFAYTQIVRKLGGFPESPIDGTVVYSGTAEQAVDSGVVANYQYFYAGFSVDSSGNQSPRAEFILDTRRYSIEGTLTKADGQPLAGARIVLTANDGSNDIYDAVSGPDGHYTLSNLENNPYTLTAEKTGYLFRVAPRGVDVNIANLVEDFIADPAPALSLLFDPTRVYVGRSYDIRWGCVNITDTDMVDVRLDRGNGWETIASNLPILDGVMKWTVTGPASGEVTMEITLASDATVKSTRTFAVSESPNALVDAIRYLKVIAGLSSTGIDVHVSDVDSDEKVGLGEVIDALQRASLE